MKIACAPLDQKAGKTTTDTGTAGGATSTPAPALANKAVAQPTGDVVGTSTVFSTTYLSAGAAAPTPAVEKAAASALTGDSTTNSTSSADTAGASDSSAATGDTAKGAKAVADPASDSAGGSSASVEGASDTSSAAGSKATGGSDDSSTGKSYPVFLCAMFESRALELSMSKCQIPRNIKSLSFELFGS